MRDPLITELEWLTRGVRAIRIGYQIAKERRMALEIKGLKGKALKARANIDALNVAYDKFNETAPAHVADVDGLTSQVTGMQEDLQFAVNVLGNSTVESEKPIVPPANELGLDATAYRMFEAGMPLPVAKTVNGS